MSTLGKRIPGNGGRRPGAGRKVSSTTVRTRAVAEAFSKDQGITPLEVMVRTMRALWAKAERKGKPLNLPAAVQACEIAEKAARFMHPTLASVEQFIDAKVRQFAVSDKPVTEDEWDRTYGPLATAGGPSESAH